MKKKKETNEKYLGFNAKEEEKSEVTRSFIRLENSAMIFFVNLLTITLISLEIWLIRLLFIKDGKLTTKIGVRLTNSSSRC